MEAIQNSIIWSFFVDLTDLFDWTAIGSVLVFLTLIQAIWLGNTASRRFEAQQSVMIGYVRTLLSRLSFIQKLVARVDDPRVVGSEAIALTDEIASDLARLDPSALPTQTCVEALQTCRNAVETVKGFVGPKDGHYFIYAELMPTTSELIQYYIEILKREIEDRDPRLISRISRSFARGPAPKRPPSALEKALASERS